MAATVPRSSEDEQLAGAVIQLNLASDPSPASYHEVLEWLREANRFSRIRIHTIGFEQAGKSMRKFLKRVAVQNHGEYRELR